MNEQNESDLFAWGEKNISTQADLNKSIIKPHEVNHLGVYCPQCEIVGGACASHPRQDLNIQPVSVQVEEPVRPILDNEEFDGGMRMAIKAELEHESDENLPIDAHDIEKFKSVFSKQSDL